MAGRRAKIPRNVLIVALVALVSGFGQDMIVPVLPGYLVLLGVGLSGIGLIDGLLQGATALFRFISGALSDRLHNRKRLIFLGYALSSVARPLLALAGTFGSVAALRLLDGIGKGTKDAPRDALVADSAVGETKGRAFGFQRLIDTLGSVLGPLFAAGLLLTMSASLQTYRTILLLAAVPGTAAIMLIAFGIREPVRRTVRVPQVGRLPAKFWVFTLAVVLVSFTKANDSLFLLRAGTLGVPKPWIPALFAGFTMVYALLSYPVGIWSDRVGKPPLLLAGWLVLAAVEFGFSYDMTAAPLLLLFAFYGLFYALTEGSARAFIAETVPAASRGSAYGVYYTATGLAVILGGFGIGKVWELTSPEMAFRLSAIGALAACLVLNRIIRPSLRNRGKTAMLPA